VSVLSVTQTTLSPYPAPDDCGSSP
jgi:hypothetical protein